MKKELIEIITTNIHLLTQQEQGEISNEIDSINDISDCQQRFTEIKGNIEQLISRKRFVYDECTKMKTKLVERINQITPINQEEKQNILNEINSINDISDCQQRFKKFDIFLSTLHKLKSEYSKGTLNDEIYLQNLPIIYENYKIYENKDSESFTQIFKQIDNNIIKFSKDANKFSEEEV